MLKSVFLFLLFVSFSATPLSADPSIESSVSSRVISQDESVQLSMEIMWPTDEGQYTFTIPQASPRNMVIKKQGEAQEIIRRDGKTWAKKTFTLDLYPETPGSASVGPLSIQFYNPQSFSTGLLEVPEYKVEVRRAAGFPWGIAVAGAICAASALGGLWFFRRKSRFKASPDSPDETPEDVLCREIDHFAAGEKGRRAADFAAFVHTKLQNYLSVRYELPKPEREETLVEMLASKGLPSGEINRVRRLLESLREARYSGAVTEYEQVRAEADEVKRYISSKKIVGGA